MSFRFYLPMFSLVLSANFVVSGVVLSIKSIINSFFRVQIFSVFVARYRKNVIVIVFLNPVKPASARLNRFYFVLGVKGLM